MYLSSFRVGNCPERLVELAKGGTRAAVIANAMDAAPPQVRREAVARELHALTALRFVAEELDLRDYFGTSGAVLSELRRFDAVWLRGGNVLLDRSARGLARAPGERGSRVGCRALSAVRHTAQDPPRRGGPHH
jgi:dipeptidase E